MDNDQQQRPTFLDLITTGAPLAAIARCLHHPDSCQDQLQLAHAVGKRYRDVVLREITHLPALHLEFADSTAADFRTAASLLLRLPNVESVSPRCIAHEDCVCCDVDGVGLLRLLPRLRELNLAGLPYLADYLGVCKSVAALATLQRLCVHGYFLEATDGEADEGARCLAQLTALTQLEMGYFHVTANGVRHLTRGLTGLRELDISDVNDLTGADLSPLTNLTRLDASHASVDGHTMMHLGQLRALRRLELEGVELRPDHALHLGSSLTALTHLRLGRRPLDVESLKALSHLGSLEELLMHNSGIGDAGAAVLSLLTSVRSLNCAANGLGPLGGRHLGKCSQLRWLCVDGNMLGAEGAAHLSCLTGLRHLSISDNDVGEAGASHLAKSLPSLTSLKIQYSAYDGVGQQAPHTTLHT